MRLSDILRKKSTAFIGYLFLVATPVLLVGFAGYFGIVAPLKGKLLAEQTRSLGTGIEAAIGERANCLAMALGEGEVDDFLEDGRLQEVVRAIQSRFPDFLSLELIEASGTTLAMAGDSVTMPGQGADMETLSKPAGPFPNPARKAWTFRDDPAGDHFSITWVRPGNGTEPFFVRARFLRKSLSALMQSFSREFDGVAQLVQVADSSAGNWYDAAESGTELTAGTGTPTTSRIATSGKWFQAPLRTELRLTVPGWAVILEGNPKGILTTWQLVWTGAAALLALLLATATILRPVHPLNSGVLEPPATPSESLAPADGEPNSLTNDEDPLDEAEDGFAVASCTADESPGEAATCAEAEFAAGIESGVETPSFDHSGHDAYRDACDELFGADPRQSDDVRDDDFLGWPPETLSGSDFVSREEHSGGADADGRTEPWEMEEGDSFGERADVWRAESGAFARAEGEPSDAYGDSSGELSSEETRLDSAEAHGDYFLVVSWEEPPEDDHPESSSGPSLKTLP